jgi:hypothetical protein
MAKNTVSAVASKLRLLASVLSLLSEEVRKRGGTDDYLYRLSRPDHREILVEMAKLIVDDVYPVEVYQVTIDQLVELGCYDVANSKINDKHFTVDQPHKCNILLKHFDKKMDADAVLRVLDAEGLRPATVSELLALSAKYPDLLHQFNIAALGSTWEHPRYCRRVVYIRHLPGERRLELTLRLFSWRASTRFAVVRE